ncbi:hypothetical protein BZA05DRAFT_381378 [Tricharina praecox]|uniref:uncharacterized protein n=1 Tax=Tricharina praecox TaxID=43433 RepID=UPI00221E38E6|nr:uncharacterized protein BZA05DRAFT_381378 [Tricharina praecox]KAI5858483.1 hypothetical protein BZA05DRAFT_381378 [Tricharina praecox]
MLLLLFASAGFAAAAVVSSKTKAKPSTITTMTASCQSICADYINECGSTYGGCFADPKCTGGTAWPTFTAPACNSTTITEILPSTTPCPTICADYINDCGSMYGGCFPDPKCTGGTAWPTFTPPPCTNTSSTTTEPCRTICVDAINTCGMKYGGCYEDPQCNGGIKPTFTTPSCTPSASTTVSEPCGTICVDYLNPCGYRYGGCFENPRCNGGISPTFSTPPCTPSPTPTPASSSASCDSICTGYPNTCGGLYNYCMADPACTGGTTTQWPTFSLPACTPTPTPNPSITTSCDKICTGYPNTCGGEYTYCMFNPACTGGKTTQWPTLSQPPCTATASGGVTTVTKLAVRTVMRRDWKA